VERDLAALALRFEEGASEFASCPLYQELCRVVAADERLLRLAAEGRPGQQPPYLLLGAVHYLLLSDSAEELGAWYRSIAGDRVRSPPSVGPAFTAFCLERRETLIDLLHHRLVQTNVVKRAAALRLGLAHVYERVQGPVTLVEVGASAGVLLAFDRYRYRIAGKTWGQLDSPVEVVADWRGTADGVPDLDRLPAIGHRLGIDLSPIDARDELARRWLRALVWPDNEGQWELLKRALDLVASDPPRVIAGDAIEVLPLLDAELDPSWPVVVFHAATRAHVPLDRRTSLEQAIMDLAKRHRLLWLSLEGAEEPILDPAGAPLSGHVLQLVDANGRALETEQLAVFGGHADWAGPMPPS
jgi:hypothetical protein